MAQQAQTSTSTLAYVQETVLGQTPASPAFKPLARTDFTGGLSTENLTSETIRPDRQTVYSRRGNSSVEGSFSVELSPDTYDEFLQAVTQGTWTANKLQIGKIQRTFAVEQGLELEGGYQYRVLNGVAVNTMSMEITTGDLVSASFGLVGMTETDFSASSADANGYEIVPPKDIFYHEDGTFREGGVDVGYLSAINFEINNNVTGTRALGTTGFRNVTSGKVSVTGSVTALFESTALYNKFVNNTDTSLGFTLTAGAESLQFEFHRIKYTNANITASGDAGVEVEMDFEALYDATAGNTLTITRV